MADPATSFLDFFNKAVASLAIGQKTRNDMLTRANQLATGMVSASTFATVRLNAALLAKGKSEKVAIIAKLSKDEIEEFTRMNGQCDLVYQSANALLHLTSPETTNIRLTGRPQARKILQTLQHGERGLQDLLNESLAAPSGLKAMSKAEIDAWIRGAIDKMCQITQSANNAVRELSKVI